MNRIEALNYLVDNRTDFDEWSGAGMSNAFMEVIKSDMEDFSKEYLDDLLNRASNF